LSKYFIALDGQRRGPFALEQLRDQPIDPATPVWHPGLEDWVRAEEVAELKQLLADLPPPLPPAPPMAPVVQKPDYLIAHPALPKMARLICLYVLVLSPALWVIGNGLVCLYKPPWRGLEGSAAAAIVLVVWLLSLGTTIVAFVGGLDIHRMNCRGTKLLKLAFSLDLVGALLSLILGILIAVATPEQVERADNLGAVDVIRFLLAFGAMGFELIALIWLWRFPRLQWMPPVTPVAGGVA